MFDRPVTHQRKYAVCPTALQPKDHIILVPDKPQVVDTPVETNLTTLLRDSALNYTPHNS